MLWNYEHIVNYVGTILLSYEMNLGLQYYNLVL